VGLVTMESLHEYMLIQAALKARRLGLGDIRRGASAGLAGD